METRWGWYLLFCVTLIFFCNFVVASDFSDDGIWQRVPEKSIQQFAGKTTGAKEYLTFRLNKEYCPKPLESGPIGVFAASKSTNVIISLPMPDGRYLRFRIEESPIMESGLAAKFPK